MPRSCRCSSVEWTLEEAKVVKYGKIWNSWIACVLRKIVGRRVAQQEQHTKVPDWREHVHMDKGQRDTDDRLLVRPGREYCLRGSCLLFLEVERVLH